jgi:hypothetical protein
MSCYKEFSVGMIPVLSVCVADKVGENCNIAWGDCCWVG